MLPLEEGRPVTKSRAKWDQGRVRMSRGRSWPKGGLLEVLFWAQIEQAFMNCMTSWDSEGHQKHWRAKANVLCIPRWQASLEEFTSHKASLTCFSTPQETAATTTPWGNMVLGSTLSPRQAKRQDIASALQFLEEGPPGLSRVQPLGINIHDELQIRVWNRQDRCSCETWLKFCKSLQCLLRPPEKDSSS